MQTAESKLDEMVTAVAALAAEAQAINSDLDESGDQDGAEWYAEAQRILNAAALALATLADRENGR